MLHVFFLTFIFSTLSYFVALRQTFRTFLKHVLITFCLLHLINKSRGQCIDLREVLLRTHERRLLSESVTLKSLLHLKNRFTDFPKMVAKQEQLFACVCVCVCVCVRVCVCTLHTQFLGI